MNNVNIKQKLQNSKELQSRKTLKTFFSKTILIGIIILSFIVLIGCSNKENFTVEEKKLWHCSI